MTRTLVIAEAGVNHNGSAELALELVDVAAAAGADVVKFQTFRADALVTRDAPKAAYQKERTAGDDQYAMLKALELDRAMHERLAARCTEKGIEFLSTAFDLESLDLVVGTGVKRLKIPSGEITNGPFLLAAARKKLPMVLSTGMSTLDEIEEALGVVAFGLLAPSQSKPTRAAFAEAFRAPEAAAALRAKVTLLHCTTSYPAALADVNLRAMDTMAERFGLPVGYSDHSEGIEVALAAVARGATTLEKHFTLSRDLPGPDHKASLEPAELRAMIAGIRRVEACLGSAAKAPTAAERPMQGIARHSLVAACAIAAGEVFSERNLASKRPGTGLSPMGYWDLLGRRAARAYAPDELIDQ